MSSKSGFWVPGAVAPGIAVDRDAGADQLPVVFNPVAHLSISSQRQQLPIYQHRDELIYAFEKYRCIVISGQAGSGKSTQVPQYLYESGWCRLGYRIICSQPRPLSAVTIATRVAQEMSMGLGGVVGYAVPFDDKRSATQSQIEFVTDRALIGEMMRDPLLSAYSVVIIDEAHERTLETDVLLGLLRKISSRRPDLRIVISSATIDADLFQDFFEMNPTASEKDSEAGTAVIVSVENSQYPVQALYAVEPVRDYVKSCVELIMNIHRRLPSGDILAFLPSKAEVDQVTFLLRERTEEKSLRALPMYAGLHLNDQIKVLEAASRSYRRAIISTNICETSVTVSSVVYVIDSGFVKQSAFDPRTGFQTLQTVPISQAEAAQRAGRAGRVCPGHVYRMYTPETFGKLQPFPSPAIRRESPDLMLLYLKAIGIQDLVHFEYLEAPSVLSLSSALQLLYSLGAIDDAVAITSVGSSLIDLQLPTRLGKALLESVAHGCSQEMIDISAMLSVNNVFSRPKNRQFSSQTSKAHKKFAVAEGDFLTLLNVWRAYDSSDNGEQWCNDFSIDFRSMRRARQIRNRIQRSWKSLGLPIVTCGEKAAPIIKTIASGFFMNCASLQRDGTYSTLSTHGMAKVHLRIHPNSVLADQSPQWVLYYDAIHTDQIYIRDLLKIDPSVLLEVAPNFFASNRP